MIANSKLNRASLKISHSDWNFLPIILSGATGMILGWALSPQELEKLAAKVEHI